VYAPWKKRADLLLLQGVAAELREALLRFGRAQASLAAVELPVRLSLRLYGEYRGSICASLIVHCLFLGNF
jgi:hypothetical protein